jgi:two-component system nitrate/nitrite response regulator NarL
VSRYVSIVLASRQPLVLCGLVSVLGAETEFKVAASCTDGNACIQAIRDLIPDLVLLDVFMPGLTGREIASMIASEQLHTRVLFLTESTESPEILTALPGEACGMVPKDVTPQFLIHCLRQVAAGVRLLPWIAPTAAAQTIENELIALTKREHQIMHLVSAGLSNKQIGRQLVVSDGTIKVHLSRIYQKLAIHNRTALAALAARQNGDIPPPAPIGPSPNCRKIEFQEPLAELQWRAEFSALNGDF